MIPKILKSALYYSDKPLELLYKIRKRCEEAAHGVAGFPSYMHIEATNACNLHCRMCPRDEMERKTGFMDFGLFRKVIDQVPEHSLTAICLQNFGESLMHPKIVEMVKYAKQHKGMGEVHLLTNCTLLSERIVGGLLDAGIDMIGLSFEGVDKKTYESLRRGADYWKVVKNIENALRLQKEMGASGTRINIQVTRMKETEDYIGGFIARWAPLLVYNDGIRIKHYDTWAGRVEDRSAKKTEATKGCRMPFRNLVVLWNGDVSICCKDVDGKELVGNANEKSIGDLWLGSGYERVRKLHREGRLSEIGLCSNCSDWHKWEREITVRSSKEEWRSG